MKKTKNYPAYMKEYSIKNREKLAAYQKEYRKNNKARIREAQQKFQQKESTKEYKKRHYYQNETQEKKDRRKILNKKYRSRPESKILKNKNEVSRKRKDLNYKLASILRSRLYTALKSKRKVGSAVKDLGCTIEQLKIHIESKFYPHPKTGELMSWENHGSCYGKWQIDHIEELHTTDLTVHENLSRVCNFKNLQPLWYEDHVIKGKSCGARRK